MFNIKINRNCECCGNGYSFGKEYGWNQTSFPVYRETTWKEKLYWLIRFKWKKYTKLKVEGLCESCNPKGNKKWGIIWYNPNLKCHAKTF